uniref:Mitochondrial import receptor subunit TOM22 homolog n=1 Tax=Sphenodon punctatus TaxID=8508 RepID=A0A8D0GDW4_SPHPU
MTTVTPLSPEQLLLPKARLWWLTEMFPENIRSVTGATFDMSLSVAQKMYRFCRAALWFFLLSLKLKNYRWSRSSNCSSDRFC